MISWNNITFLSQCSHCTSEESLQQQWKRKLRKIIKKSHSQLGQVKIILHVHYVLCMVENWFLPWTSLQTIRFFYLYSNWDLWECCRPIFVYLLHFPLQCLQPEHIIFIIFSVRKCSIPLMICFFTSRYFHPYLLQYPISISIIIKVLFHFNKSHKYAAKNWNTNNNLISFEYTIYIHLDSISSYMREWKIFPE